MVLRICQPATDAVMFAFMYVVGHPLCYTIEPTAIVFFYNVSGAAGGSGVFVICDLPGCGGPFHDKFVLGGRYHVYGF